MSSSRTAAFVAVMLATALAGCSEDPGKLSTASDKLPAVSGQQRPAGSEQLPAAAQQPPAGSGQLPVAAKKPPAAAANKPAASAFFVDPAQQAATWVRQNAGDPRAARIRQAIARQPSARWFGEWSGPITPAVSAYVGAAAKAKKTPVMVAYNIVDRDCKGQSAGGAGSAAEYRTWISQFSKGIGARPAAVVVEPDAVAMLGDCLSATARSTRLTLLKFATRQFKVNAPSAKVYIDGGNAKWIAPAEMAQRLNAAGLKDARGFAVNVSNYNTTGESVAYAKAVNAALKSTFGYTRTFIVDTSRNGNGRRGDEWCNQAGSKLGATPRVGGGAEMLLWIKAPGESDGACGVGGSTQAGTFSPDLAVRLIDGR